MNMEFMKELADLLKKHDATLYVDKVNYQDGIRVQLGYKSYVQCGFVRKEQKISLRTNMSSFSYTHFDAQHEVDRFNGVYL